MKLENKIQASYCTSVFEYTSKYMLSMQVHSCTT